MIRSVRVRFPIAALVLMHAFAGRTEPYKVKAGDSLSKIAADHEMSVQALLNANPKVKKAKGQAVHPGMVLIIPEGSPGVAPKGDAPAATEAPERPAATGVYKVKAGDSLTKIAAANKISVREILRLNPKLRKDKRHAVHVGMELAVPSNPSDGNPPTAEGAPPPKPGATPPPPAPPPEKPAPAPTDAGTASKLRDGVTKGGWVVTYNPDIGRNVLFVHRSSGGGMLTGLEYYVEESGDGKWTVYGASDSYIDGSKVKGKARTVMNKPSGVSMGQCSCQ